MKSVSQRAETIVNALMARNPLLFINGIGAESEGNATIQICNPADGSPVGRVPAANEADVDRAVDAAAVAHDSVWRDLAPSERGAILHRAADVLEHNAEDLAILESIQTGKTFREALTIDVHHAILALRYYAGFTNKRGGELFDLGNGYLGFVHKDPHPVVGLILSWTFPLMAAVVKAAAALAAGSCVVIKPSELAPLSAMRLAELMMKAGLPPGVLNVVTGFGNQAGEALAGHPQVSSLTFNGSIDSARRAVLASAKSNLKPVQLILGGKGANIIFEDADLKKAMSSAWKAVFTHRGEVNTAGSRLLVHHTLYDKVVSVVTARARQMVLGDPLDDHTEMGPVISEAHMNKTLAYVELGRREGARLVAGGSRDDDGAKAAGFFVRPTVFMDVEANMRIAREEIAGPVLSILKFRHDDEALEIANGTDYGLAHALWTHNLARAHRLARKLRAGVVWINHYDQIDPALPFGGVGLSGHGRDLGAAGLDQFTSSKSVYLPT